MSGRKSVKHVVERIALMGELSEEETEVVRHMIESLIRNRDVLIDKLKVRADALEQSPTLKMVSGALKECIAAHGPVTKEWTGSAAKRILRKMHAPRDCQPPHLRLRDVYAEAGFSPCEGLTVHDDPPANIWGYWRDPRWKEVYELRNNGQHSVAKLQAAIIRDDWGVE